jgi:hypothetical protein
VLDGTVAVVQPREVESEQRGGELNIFELGLMLTMLEGGAHCMGKAWIVAGSDLRGAD